MLPIKSYEPEKIFLILEIRRKHPPKSQSIVPGGRFPLVQKSGKFSQAHTI